MTSHKPSTLIFWRKRGRGEGEGGRGEGERKCEYIGGSRQLDLAWIAPEIQCHQSSSFPVSTLSLRNSFILRLLWPTAAPGLLPFCWVTTREKSDLSLHSSSTKFLEIGLIRSSWVIYLSLNKSLWPEECSGLIGQAWTTHSTYKIGVELFLSTSYGLRVEERREGIKVLSPQEE